MEGHDRSLSSYGIVSPTSYPLLHVCGINAGNDVSGGGDGSGSGCDDDFMTEYGWTRFKQRFSQIWQREAPNLVLPDQIPLLDLALHDQIQPQGSADLAL
ncbi:Uncharacterized protein TCM_036444 [Theobroma cacao]|uniref:Uncharacterized protein n=1 Tax=Theobroma cacao TaxID=3641 RepID=A0A061FJP6_THECC|nr:Uncharacterized protein TCM_036444 [Theobroma cacao]